MLSSDDHKLERINDCLNDTLKVYELFMHEIKMYISRLTSINSLD